MTSGTLTVAIPTWNSERTIRAAVESVLAQNYPCDIYVIDGGSHDTTEQQVADLPVTFLPAEAALLRAREIGALTASTDYVLLLDSDQQLRPGTLTRAMDVIGPESTLALMEASGDGHGWLPQLFAADRRVIHRDIESHSDPQTGALLPRLFLRTHLLAAFTSIPERLKDRVVAHDHAIVWHEVRRLFAPTLIVLPDAVTHYEPATLRDLWRKNFRYGLTTQALLREAPEYRSLVSPLRHVRRWQLSTWRDGVKSLALTALKGPPYLAGLLGARLRQGR